LESGGALTVDRTLRDLFPIKISVFYIVQFDKGSPLKNGFWIKMGVFRIDHLLRYGSLGADLYKFEILSK